MPLGVGLLAAGAAVVVVVGGGILYRYAGDDAQDSASGSRGAAGKHAISGPISGDTADASTSADAGDNSGADAPSNKVGGRSKSDLRPSSRSADAQADEDDATAVAHEYHDDSGRDEETAVAENHLDSPEAEPDTSPRREMRCSECGTHIDPTAAVCPSCGAIIWSDCDVLLHGDGMAVELDCGESVGPALRRALTRAGVSNDDVRRVRTEHLLFQIRGSGIEVRNCTTTASALKLDGCPVEPDESQPVSDGQRLTVAGQFEFTVRIPP